MDGPAYVPGQRVRVEFYKYPERRLHYWWQAEVARVRRDGVRGRDPGGALVYAPAGFELHHESKQGVWRMGHHAYLAFFPGRWYSGGPDLDRNGRVLAY